MDLFGSDISWVLPLVVILLALRIFLPGILRPLRPKTQSTSTLNIINRLKGEDIQDMTNEQWERVKYLAGLENGIQLARAQNQANNWMKGLMNRGFEDERQ